MKKTDRRQRPATALRRRDTSELAHAVRQLPPEAVHQAIETRGLDACRDLIALVTPHQLQRVLDLDLWRPARPGMEATLDADRFAEWVEMLMQLDTTAALQTLQNIDDDLVIAALAQHVRVFDRATLETDDGSVGCEVGGYVVEARRSNAWDTVVGLLRFLEAEGPDYFHRVMRGCRSLSNSKPEVDGLDDLLTDGEQRMFDLAVDRDERREAQGYVAPAEARAFLQAARELRVDMSIAPATSLVADPRALVEAPGSASRFARLQSFLDTAGARDQATLVTRTGELAFLANTMGAGCAVQERPLTPHEASEAAAAVCNLGLENWPVQWRQDSLIDVFRVGWTVLYRNVCLHAAEGLIHAAAELPTRDREIQSGLRALRFDLARHWRAGDPWRAREALDVILLLDQPAWATLLGLIAEFPVIHAGMRVARGSASAVDPHAFEFISENRQVDAVRDFSERLLERLRD